MLGALAGVGVLAACGSTTPDADGARLPAGASGTLRFNVVKTGSIADQGRGGGARGRLVRDSSRAASILRAWDMERAIPTARAVDYSRRSLVIVLGGSAPDTAYRLAVRRVSVRSRRVNVRADVRRRAGAIGGTAISRPYALLTVARRDVAGAASTVSVTIADP